MFNNIGIVFYENVNFFIFIKKLSFRKKFADVYIFLLICEKYLRRKWKKFQVRTPYCFL